jgi:tetratricopeptide (TPR) repeat protein
MRFDRYLVERLTKKPTETLEAAVAQLKAGEQEDGLRALSALAEDLRDVRLRTRLQAVRTRTLDQLGGALLAAGRHDEAMQWTQELLEYDPRDFPALVRRAELHRRAGNDEAELADIRAAFHVGGATGQASGPFIGAMARHGLREELATSLLRLGRSGPLQLPARGWQLRWTEAPGSSYGSIVNLTPQIDPGTGRLRCAAPMQAGVSAAAHQIRVDLPQGVHASLQDLQLEVTLEDGSQRTLGAPQIVQAHHLETTGDAGFRAEGMPDPFVVFESPGAELLRGVKHISMTLEGHPLLPLAARELFRGGLRPDERAAWTLRFGADLVSALEETLGL